MAVINTLVAKSDSTRSAALNINAKAYEVRQTIAGVWDLKPCDTKPPPPSSTFQLDMKNHTDESVVGDSDERVKVDVKHFLPGGKYRSIVKLFIHYEFQEHGRWAMGTGWLVKPDIFVTAGHCSYDWNHQLGRATEVKAYIGYNGSESIKDANTQFRHVKRIVTTEGWLKARGAKNFDVSFMQVEKPFTGVTPIVYSETPESGQYELGVVGYPGDLKDEKSGEKGAHMYEMFLDTAYDLATQADTMLEYQIDTFGGNSGSPVLRKPKLDSIGAHVYGGTFNSASVIGRYGNPYNDYLMGFGSPLPNDGLNLVPVKATAVVAAPFGPFSQSNTAGQSNGTSQSNAASQSNGNLYGLRFGAQTPTRSSNRGLQAPLDVNPRSHSTATLRPSRLQAPYGAEAGEEGFLDIIKSAVRVGAPLVGGVLKTGLPMALGPLGGPIGALAGFALNAAGKLAESTDAESFDPSTAHEGTMERAILAEAALTAVQTMNLHPDDQESIFSDMKDFIIKAAPTIKKVAPKVMGAVMEPALRMALNSLHNYNEKGMTGAEAFEDQSQEPFRPNIQYTARIDQPGDRNTEAFVKGLQNAMMQGQEALDDESQEGFFDIISAGARLAGQGLMGAARVGLPILAKMVQGGAESAEATDSAAASSALSSGDLAKRALVGEAALQALMKLPPQTLQEEGFFDFVASAVKKIAPVVVKVAPAVISNLSPTLGGLIKSVTGQEAAFVSATAKVYGAKSLASKRSASVLRQGNTGGDDFLSKVQGWDAGRAY